MKLARTKKDYFSYLDRKARNIAYNLVKKKPVTHTLLDYIKELYDSAKSDNFFENKRFETAYHNPISSEFEFLVARILYHYSNFKNLDWKVYLRRQVGKTAPDIRIEQKGKTLAIIEIKAKAGFIQPLFSSERIKKDMMKFRKRKSKFDPRQFIRDIKKHFKKYYQTYNINSKQIFVLLPSLRLVHRKKSARQIKDYKNDFAKNSGLPKSSLILLSTNLSLDLSMNPSRSEYAQTSQLEKFITFLNKLSKR